MPTEVEAQITGSVWKIEKAVGDRSRGRRRDPDPRVDEDGDSRRGAVRGTLAELRVQRRPDVEEGAVLAVIE